MSVGVRKEVRPCWDKFMQKVTISQPELDQANGRFDDYMLFVTQRLAAKHVDPKIALFEAVTLIGKDGFQISLGSHKDAAAQNVSRWFDSYYGKRQHISYCLPQVACAINGSVHLLRMPILRPERMQLTEAVVDLTVPMAGLISSKQMKSLAEMYNEFYDALHLIAQFDKTTIVHLETSARYLADGAALYAEARWESHHFVEKAMKEVLEPTGIAITGAAGHEIEGALNNAWQEINKPPLPADLLADASCSTAMRYERTLQPMELTLRAHHAAIRLGARIAKCLPEIPPMVDELSISPRALKRDPVLSVIRAIAAIDTLPSVPIRLHR